MRKKIVSTLVVVLLILMGVVLCLGRILPITFEKIVPEYRTCTTRCAVNSLEQNTFLIKAEYCKLFLEQLEGYKYYYEWKHGKIYEGNLYHLDIINENTNELISTIVISDKAILYTDANQYRLEGDIKELWGWLKADK